MYWFFFADVMISSVKFLRNQYGPQAREMQTLSEAWRLLLHLHGGQCRPARGDGYGMHPGKSEYNVQMGNGHTSMSF